MAEPNLKGIYTEPKLQTQDHRSERLIKTMNEQSIEFEPQDSQIHTKSKPPPSSGKFECSNVILSAPEKKKKQTILRLEGRNVSFTAPPNEEEIKRNTIELAWK